MKLDPKNNVEWKHQYRVRNHWIDVIVTTNNLYDPEKYAKKVAITYGHKYLGLKDNQLKDLFVVKVCDFSKEAVLNVNRLFDAEKLKDLGQ